MVNIRKNDLFDLLELTCKTSKTTDCQKSKGECRIIEICDTYGLASPCE